MLIFIRRWWLVGLIAEAALFVFTYTTGTPTYRLLSRIVAALQ
jgi:hypothetical protein